MTKEIEAKFHVSSFGRVQRSLEEAQAEYRGTVLQTDQYFDTHDRSLLAGDRGLRLRTTRRLKAGGQIDTRPLLTFKGPRSGTQAKVRHETQTHVDHPQALADVFHAAGLEPTITIQKRRKSYRLGNCLIELDELPLIGKFVEIEAPSPKRLREVAQMLRLPGPPIRQHYISLVQEYCRKAGKTCRQVTFARCRKCS